MTLVLRLRYNQVICINQEGAVFQIMKFQDKEFIPVLLGGDINTYSVARAFYEQYRVKTYIFGKLQKNMRIKRLS